MKKYIDTYLYTQLTSETPAYLAMLRERLTDLCDRGVSKSDAPAYLASAGWGRNIAKYYEDLINFANKQENTMENSNNNSMTFSAEQMTALLGALLEDLTKAAGFRARLDSETLKDYRLSFSDFLKNSIRIDREVAQLQIQQLDQCLETVKAQKAHYLYLLNEFSAESSK